MKGIFKNIKSSVNYNKSFSNLEQTDVAEGTVGFAHVLNLKVELKDIPELLNYGQWQANK